MKTGFFEKAIKSQKVYSFLLEFPQGQFLTQDMHKDTIFTNGTTVCHKAASQLSEKQLLPVSLHRKKRSATSVGLVSCAGTGLSHRVWGIVLS